MKRQWADFDYKLDTGESLREVQIRNVAALEDLLHQHVGEHIAIAGHGTTLCTLFHHFNPNFGFEDFWSLVDRMPFIVRARFQGTALLDREELSLEAG